MISPELAIAVLSVVMYIWRCKRDPGARKHVSNAKVIPVVPRAFFKDLPVGGPGGHSWKGTFMVSVLN